MRGKKVQGWRIFHAYDIQARAHPPMLNQERETGESSFEDGLPDHVTRKEAAMGKKQFKTKGPRAS